MHLVFDLPSPLITELLSGWLGLATLIKLDSAVCNRACRATFVEILRGNEFCFSVDQPLRLIKSKEMEWFISRGTKRNQVHVDEKLLKSAGTVRPFLRGTSAHLERLRCIQLNLAQLRPFDFMFSKLHSLTLCDVGTLLGGKDVEALLSCCAHTLQQLKLESSYVGSASCGLPFPDLLELCLVDSKICQAILHKLIVSSPRLRSFCCDAIEEEHGDACLEALAGHCPLLQVLAFDNSGSSETLIRLFKACPLIEVVELPCDDSYPHILAALENCQRLRAFCAVGDVMEYFEEYIPALQARLPDLRHLSLFDCNFHSDTSILALAPYCGNLRTLEVSQAALINLVHNLRSVTELNLHDAWHGEEVMKEIGAQCKNMRVLHLCRARGYTADGILAVAQGCAALKTLWVVPVDKVLTSTVRRFWQLLRPGLQVSYDLEDACVFWTALWDVDRKERVAV
jgi:hypothetical protein